MTDPIEVRVPDIGDFDAVDVIEVLVSAGDVVAVDDGLITLESDKASMEVPSSAAGTVAEVLVATGDQVKEGDPIVRLTAAAGDAAIPADDAPETADDASAASAPPAPAPAAPAGLTAAAAGDPDDADLTVDVVVLGSGPGGYSAAFRAADLGLRVALIERFASLGGVCLNVGCIPSKALLHMAKVVDEARHFRDHGIEFGAPTIDLDKLRSWKDGVVGRLTGGLTTLAKQRKVTTVQGYGRFLDAHRLAVAAEDGSTTVVGFHHAIIAAGSRPVEIPGFPIDDPRLMDSTGALELTDIPNKLLVIGGGIIGLEMATVYEALGSAVTVVELMDGLMPGADPDIVRPLHRRIKKKYAAIHLGTKVTQIEAEDDGLRAHFERANGADAPEPALFDRVLVSVGRRPNGGRIDADRAGVAVDERGFIAVDKQMRTNVAHIFAIGDLVGQPMLAHKAVHEGKVAAEVIAGHRVAFDARVIPSVAYTDPEVAWVGLTELEAKQQNVAYEKGVFPWAASGRSLALGRDEGVTKMLFDPDSGRVLGAGIVGPAAGDLIAEVALAIEMGCDASDIGLTIHPHPTLSETVGMSAEAFEGTLTDLYLPKNKKKAKQHAAGG